MSVICLLSSLPSPWPVKGFKCIAWTGTVGSKSPKVTLNTTACTIYKFNSDTYVIMEVSKLLLYCCSATKSKCLVNLDSILFSWWEGTGYGLWISWLRGSFYVAMYWLCFTFNHSRQLWEQYTVVITQAERLGERGLLWLVLFKRVKWQFYYYYYHQQISWVHCNVTVIRM